MILHTCWDDIKWPTLVASAAVAETSFVKMAMTLGSKSCISNYSHKHTVSQVSFKAVGSAVMYLWKWCNNLFHIFLPISEQQYVKDRFNEG